MLSGCGETEITPTTECDHSYMSVVTKDATYDQTGSITYTCEKCQDSYTEEIPKKEKHVVPNSVLDNAVSYAKYSVPPFSINVGKLINTAMPNYSGKHYTGEDAIAKGYLTRSQIDSSVNIDNVYCSIVSGDVMINPDIPYMTQYEEQALKI